MAHKTVTIRDVAKKAGVAMSTASRALGDGSASPATRLKVQQAAKELHFVPNAAASRLPSGRSNIVAIVVTESAEFVFKDAFISSTVNLLMNEFTHRQLMPFLIVVSNDDSAGFEKLLHNSGADGMVVVSFHYSKRNAKVIHNFDKPTVFVGKPPVGMNYPYVDIDQVQGGFEVAQLLLKRGRSRIAIIEGPKDMRAPHEVNDRTRGCLRALDSADISALGIISCNFTVDGGIESTRTLLKRYPQVDGIIAHSDQIAAGVLHELHRQHRQVPKDVAVVGFDDFEIATATSPRLTTVAWPLSDMAKAAIDMLTDRLKYGRWKTSAQIFPTRVVQRESV